MPETLLREEIMVNIDKEYRNFNVLCGGKLFWNTFRFKLRCVLAS